MSINETPGISPSVAEKSPSSRDLPPPRKSRALRRVSPPLSKIPLNKFIYILTLILLVIGAFYGYRLVQHKSLRQVGVWWNQLLGSPIQRDGPAVGGDRVGEKHKSCNPDMTVEDRIKALAEALGVPSSDLVHAIAGAVRHYVPPASLSSIVAKETGEAVRFWTDDDEFVDGNPGQGTKGSATGIFGSVVGSEDFVGMDEP